MLVKLKTPEILCFRNNDKLIFNHVWGKTLRDGSTNLFAACCNKYPNVCPIKVIGIGVDLTNGFLFCPTSPAGEIVDEPFSYSAAESRFKAYLNKSHLTPAGTLHSF